MISNKEGVGKMPKIKIALTTHNRYEVFKKSYGMWKKFLPKGAEIFVIDDGSTEPVPEADFRFETPQGIAAAKNKGFELMGKADFYFQIDDDIYPLNKNWYKKYVESGINHLCLGFDRFTNGFRNGHELIKTDDKFDYWREPCGLMMMFTPICLEQAGGMDTRYGQWSGEHENLSRRIHNLGLTPYPFMDVKNGIKNFYSFDQHQSAERSVDGPTRRKLWATNKQLLVKEINSKAYYPFKPLEDVFITTLFTEMVDPQRGEKWGGNEGVLEELIISLKGKHLIVLSDTIEGFEDGVSYVLVKTTVDNPYWQRWLSIKEHLDTHRYGKVFIVDGTDVTLMRDPFPHLMPGKLYLGDEPSLLRNPWLMKNHPQKIYEKMYQVGCDWRLLNAGLCGGHYITVKSFIDKMVEHYHEYAKDTYTDMPGFNFVAYNYFKGNIIHGKQINNTFKSYADNGICFFLHK